MGAVKHGVNLGNVGDEKLEGDKNERMRDKTEKKKNGKCLMMIDKMMIKCKSTS